MSFVVYWTTKPLTGNRGLGTDSGEKALETAFRPMGCSSYVNFPLNLVRGSDREYQFADLLICDLE